MPAKYIWQDNNAVFLFHSIILNKQQAVVKRVHNPTKQAKHLYGEESVCQFCLRVCTHHMSHAAYLLVDAAICPGGTRGGYLKAPALTFVSARKSVGRPICTEYIFMKSGEQR